MPKRVLVTGASGFVGANLAQRLISDGHDVHLLLRPNRDRWRLEGITGVVAARTHAAELSDRDSVVKAVQAARPEWIFHLAAHGAYSTQTTFDEMVRTNLVGTVNLVEACLGSGFESFVNTGSSSEYGFTDHAPAETDAPIPNSHYALTKAAATLYCGFAARKHGVPIRTLRLYSVYGPWEDPARLIPRLIVQGLRHRLPPLADRLVARDFVFVDDVCAAYLAAAAGKGAAPDAVFNVGTGVQSTLQEVVRIACRELDIDSEPQWGSMPNRVWDTETWVADNRKIRAQLGWSPTRSLEEGLAATIHWFRSNPRQLAFYESRVSSS